MNFGEFARRMIDERLQDGHWHNWVLIRDVDSSNSLGKRIVSAAAKVEVALVPTVIVAWGQTAGRGRGENRWISPAGLGVYTTLVLPAVERVELLSLPLLVAVALARGLEPYLERPVGLRWPNDLLVSGRKIGGILIEVLSSGDPGPTAIIGYGVNHGQNEQQLPTQESTSVALEAGAAPQLPELVKRLAEAVGSELTRSNDAGYAVEEYRQRSVHTPGDLMRCRSRGEVKEGLFMGFDDRGFLRLLTKERELTLAAGELLEDRVAGRTD